MTEKYKEPKYYESMSLSLSIYVIVMLYTIFGIFMYTQISLYLKLCVGLFLFVPLYIVKKDSEARMKRSLFLELVMDFELFRCFENVFEKEKKKPKKYFIF